METAIHHHLAYTEFLELLPRLADTVNHATRNSLMGELTKGGARMIAGARVTFIAGNRVNHIEDGNESSIEADTIVLAMGARSENKLYEDLRNLTLDVRLIGDAKEPRLILHAVREGFYVGHDI